MLRHRLADTPACVLAGPDRLALARQALGHPPSSMEQERNGGEGGDAMGVGGTPPGVVGAIVLDDGLQHLRMARDLEAGAYTRSR